MHASSNMFGVKQSIVSYSNRYNLDFILELFQILVCSEQTYNRDFRLNWLGVPPVWDSSAVKKDGVELTLINYLLKKTLVYIL